jgi:hypothetical protein
MPGQIIAALVGSRFALSGHGGNVAPYLASRKACRAGLDHWIIQAHRDSRLWLAKVVIPTTKTDVEDLCSRFV